MGSTMTNIRNGVGMSLAFWVAAAAVVATPASEAYAQTRVEMRLADDAYFVGEDPLLKVKVTAPTDKPLRIIKGELAVVAQRLKTDLFDAAGKPIYGWLPHGSTQERPEDFIDVAA